MMLEIGKKIMVKRKEKAWTQEQLALAVGVTPPAVSKWETGASYPDITLLPPLARALDTTVDELLAFQKELSDQEVTGLAEKAAWIYESRGFDAGWQFCQKQIQEYPNSIPLKFHLGGLFQNFIPIRAESERQETLTYYQQSAQLYEAVLASGHPKYTFPATLILVSHYLLLNRPDQAEALLAGLPHIKIDPQMLYASLYALQGEKEKALKLVQESLYQYAGRLGQSLWMLCAFAKEQQDLPRAAAISQLHLKLAEQFGVGKETAYPERIKILADQQKTEEALELLETYVDHILTLRWDHQDPLLFDRLTLGPENPSYIKKVLAQCLLADQGYARLKEEPRFVKAMEALAQVRDVPTHTFHRPSYPEQLDS